MPGAEKDFAIPPGLNLTREIEKQNFPVLSVEFLSQFCLLLSI